MVVALVVGDKTHGVLSHNLFDLFVGFLDELFLLGRDDDVTQVEGETATECLTVAHVLDVVEEGSGNGIATLGENVANDVAQRFLAHHLVDEAILAGDNLVEDDTANGSAKTIGLDVVAFGINNGVTVNVALDFELGATVKGSFGGSAAVDVGEHIAFLVLDDLHEGAVGLHIGIFVETMVLVELHGDAGIEVNTFLIVSNDNLFGGVEALTLALDNLVGSGTAGLGHIVQTEHHVLRRNSDRSTISGVEDVVGGQHQQLSLEDSSITHGNVNCHLVTIEVSVESGTHQRVETDGLALDEARLEGLDAETVQRRSTVQQDGMALQDVFKDFPYNRLFAVDDALGRLDSLHQTALEEFTDDIRFEELGCHILGQTALVHSQLGANHNDRTARIVDTLTEQILTEATLLALEGIGERLEGAVGVGLHTGDLAAIVEERIDRLLKHALLIAHDDLGSLDFDKAFQAVVADDDSTIELVDVGSGKTTTIQGHERTQVGRNDWNDVHDHPLGTIVHSTCMHGTLRLAEGFNDIQALQGFLLTGNGGFTRSFGTELIGELIEVEIAKELVKSLGTHTSDEFVGIIVGKLVIAFGQRILNIVVLLFGEQVEALHRHLIEDGLAGLQDDVFFVIDDLVEFLGRDVEECTNLVGQGAEEPNVGNGDHKFDVTHTLTADLLLGNFNTATVADNTLVADTFIFATVALPVARGAEDTLAEQAITFGLVGAIVYGFRLGHLAIGATLDGLGRRKTDGDRVEIVLNLRFLFKSHCSFFLL